MTMFEGEVGRRRAALMAIGLIHGLCAYALREADTVWRDGQRLLNAGWILVGTAPLLAILGYQAKRALPTAAYSLGTGLLLAALFALADWRLDWDNGTSPIVSSIGVAAIITGYISLPYFQAAMEEKALRFPYDRLFHHAWNNIFYILIALLFSGVLWLVLLLWGALFSLLEISFFSELFAESWFWLPVQGLAFGLAVALLRENAATIATARRIVIALFRVLAPILAVALLLFLVALSFTGLAPIADIGSVTGVMLAVTGLSVLFANAVIQDGTGESRFPPLINGLVATNMLALVAFAGLAVYGAGVRVAQYGLTPYRVYLLILVGVAALYALAYAIAVLWRRKEWPQAVRRFNPYLAPVAVTLVLLVHTPLLEPHRLSAANQYHRLQSGAVSASAFDYAHLKFALGRFGREMLEAIWQDTTLADRDIIERQLAVVDEMDRSYWRSRRPQVRATREAVDAIRIWPEDKEIPETLSEKLLQDLSTRLASCPARQEYPCVLLMIDLTGDDTPEATLIIDRNYYLYERKAEDGNWSRIESRFMRNVSGEKLDALHTAIDAGDIETVEPPPARSWLRIGNEILKP